MKDNTPTAVIVGFDEYHVNIYCPHCGQVHSHGKDGGPGHVSSHCLDPMINDPKRLGYDIPAFDTYDPVKSAELEKIAKENKKVARRQRLHRRYS